METGTGAVDDVEGIAAECPTAQVEESPVLVVDPGQVIRVGARFRGDPERVLFSMLAPGELTATHDPPWGMDDSPIERLAPRTYRRCIDTRGMRAGEIGWWRLSSEDSARSADLQRASVGRFQVRVVPDALLDRPGTADAARRAAEQSAERALDVAHVTGMHAPRPSGYVLLGRTVSAEGAHLDRWLIGAKVVAAVIGAAVAVVL